MSVSSIKKSQKESLLFRAISQLFSQTTLDDNRLQGVAVNRVKLSDDKSHATIYFYIPGGPAEFKEKLPFILLYKSIIRKALAQSINARYTPELVFKYDDQFEKQQRIERLLEKIKGEDSSESSD